MTLHGVETASADCASYQPTPRDMLLLEAPVGVKVSPDGNRVAISVRTTNWKDNRYDNVCHVHDVATGITHPVNRMGSVNQMEWVDDQTLALLKQDPGNGDKAQIWLYEGLVGEGWAVTDHKTGVEWFKPFAGGLLFLARHPEREERKSRADRFGKFTHFEQEDSASALYYVALAELQQYQAQVKASTEDQAKELVPPVVELSRLLDQPLSIREVTPSPTDDALYLNCWRRDDLVYFRETSTYHIKLDARAVLAEHLRRERVKMREKGDSARKSDREGQGEEEEDVSYLGEIARLNLPPGATVAAVSPDGRKLLVAHQGREDVHPSGSMADRHRNSPAGSRTGRLPGRDAQHFGFPRPRCDRQVLDGERHLWRLCRWHMHSDSTLWGRWAGRASRPAGCVPFVGLPHLFGGTHRPGRGERSDVPRSLSSGAFWPRVTVASEAIERFRTGSRRLGSGYGGDDPLEEQRRHGDRRGAAQTSRL